MEHIQKNSPDAVNIGANTNPHPSPDATKAISTLTAKLALAGHAVHETADSGFFVSKYGMSYFAKDFADLEGFAKRLGVN
jgi:hypothetical protein